MPWKTVSKGGKFAVVKKGSNEVVAMHPTKEKADAQVSALYSKYNGEGKKSPKKRRNAKQQGLKEAAARRLEKNNKKKGKKNYPTNNNLRDNSNKHTYG